MKKNNKSISFITGFFIYFLVASAWNHVDNVYIPLKQSIAGGNYSSAILLGIVLFSFIVIGGCVVKLVMNIDKKKFFTKQNYICFYIMGCSLYLPILTNTLIGRMICQTDIQMDHALYIAAGTFMFILAEIFRYGYRLKEEQELTI